MHSRLSDQIESWHHASPSSSLQAARPSCFVLSSPQSGSVILICQQVLPPTSSLHSAPTAPAEQAQYMPVKIPASERNKGGRIHGIHGIAGIRNAWQSKKKCSPIKVKLKTGVSPARVKQFPLRIQDCRTIKDTISKFLNFGLLIG